ncbi:MAG: biotin/lipoyl-binding protein, partial [Chloroflexota bacterium]|nr:biotin/lipoyl-binding protein [Chloroflexota bacterium]
MRHKLLLAILAVVLVGGSYAGYTRFATPTAASSADLKTAKVDKGTVTLTVSTTGNIIMPRQVKLTFGSSGTVNEVNVKQGRTVKKGDVLARLDTKNLQQAVDLAQANLLAAEDALQKIKEPYTAADLAKAKAAVQDAQAKLKTARDDLQKAKEPTAADLAKAKAAVQDAQAKLDTARDDLQKAKEPTAADLAKAKAAVQDAQAKLKTAQDDLQKAKEPYTAADLAKAKAAVQTAVAAVTKAQEDLADAQNPYTQNDIANAEAAVRQAQGAVASAEANIAVVQNSNGVAVQDAYNALWDLRARQRSQDDIDKAQNNLDLARLRETKTNTEAQDAIAKAKDTLRDAQAKLDLIIQGPKPGDVAVKQGALLQAQANLLKAREDLDKMIADPIVVATRESAVAQAQANLLKAREDLDKMIADPIVVATRESAVA